MSKSLIKKIAIGAAAVLGLVAFFMLFAKGLVSKADGKTGYTLLEMTFGKKVTYPVGGEREVLKFSFLNLLPFILVLGAVAVSVLNLFGKAGKFGAYIAAALFVVAAILFFLAIQFTVVANAPADYKLSDYCKLAAGPIVAGIFSIIAAILSVFANFIKE